MISQQLTPAQEALQRKLTQEVQNNEQILWCAGPDSAHRATTFSIRAFLSSRVGLRLIMVCIILISLLSASLTYQDENNFILPITYAVVLLLLVIVGVSHVYRNTARIQNQLQHTVYGITSHRLIVLTQSRDHTLQNSYYAADLGRIDLIERTDGWGDIVLGGHQRIGNVVLSTAVASPRLAGVAHVRQVATLLEGLKQQ